MVKLLKNKKGESLAETLIAVMVVAFASLTLVCMMLAARNTVTDGGEFLQEYHDAEVAMDNAVSEKDADGTTETSLTIIRDHELNVSKTVTALTDTDSGLTAFWGE